MVTIWALFSGWTVPSCNQVLEGASVGIPGSYTFMSEAERNGDQTPGEAVLVRGAPSSCSRKSESSVWLQSMRSDTLLCVVWFYELTLATPGWGGDTLITLNQHLSGCPHTHCHPFSAWEARVSGAGWERRDRGWCCYRGNSGASTYQDSQGPYRFTSWDWPWRRKWQPTPVFLPGASHGQRSLVGYSPWGHKSRTWLSN